MHSFLIPTAAAVTLLATAAFAFPGPTACALVGFAGLRTVGDGLRTDSASPADQQRYIQLVRDGRARIEATFGALESTPVLVFFNGPDGFGPFKLNSYGSTQMIGSRACVMVGPNGHNVDVVAHELMHGELHHRVGPWRRMLKMPTWFDEGVAMQVDYRSRYDIASQRVPQAVDVRALTTASSFFVADDDTLTRHYASAKQLVAAWMSTAGSHTLYARLHRLRSGESFSEIIPEEEWTGSRSRPSGKR